MPHSSRAAVVYGSRAGTGGLGHCVASAITALALNDQPVTALGPGFDEPWALPGGLPKTRWVGSPEGVPRWKANYTWLRWRKGAYVYRNDQAIGRWAASQLERLRPASLYTFTQVSLEALGWARRAEVPTVLDNPNGHIRNFREVCERESLRWCGKAFTGHPTPSMVDRVEEEYRLAGSIRVYSQWAKRTMGNASQKVHMFRQTINLERFQVPVEKPASSGPLRVCYAGSVDLRKGFPYLLRAIRSLGSRQVALQIVGATGDRDCARLLAREKFGLQVQVAPGDPVRAYHESDIFVLPSLEDGFGLVVAEAMACGVPVIATDCCGSAECIEEDVNGWKVKAADVEALAAVLEKAIHRRQDLPEMGRQGRAAIEACCGPRQLDHLSAWFYSHSARV